MYESKIHILNDGFLIIPRFKNESDPVFKKFPTLRLPEIRLGVFSYLIQTDGLNILIDNGKGNRLGNSYGKYIFGERVSIEKQLIDKGILPNQIDYVVNTHLHFDHCSGNTKIDNGHVVPVYSNAKYVIQKLEYEYALQIYKTDNSYIQENFLPINKFGMLMMIDGDFQLSESVELLLCGGHTPGMMIVKHTDKNNIFYFVSDLIPTRHNVKLDNPENVDFDNDQTRKYKNELLNRCAADKAVIVFQHSIIAEACQIEKREDKFHFKRFNFNERFLI
ncbi:MAG: MBL fold metallo-hydrolase [Candidatus Delongbacteria bacterium]|nr:MBL fold metallo-hydrolase [Candidatus Delongbacteria bacterium]MBN2835078.1 MBL fold metallo-hydrolase [Candidatus Delongbacteria bacterium]